MGLYRDSGQEDGNYDLRLGFRISSKDDGEHADGHNASLNPVNFQACLCPFTSGLCRASVNPVRRASSSDTGNHPVFLPDGMAGLDHTPPTNYFVTFL